MSCVIPALRVDFTHFRLSCREQKFNLILRFTCSFFHFIIGYWLLVKQFLTFIHRCEENVSRTFLSNNFHFTEMTCEQRILPTYVPTIRIFLICEKKNRITYTHPSLTIFTIHLFLSPESLRSLSSPYVTSKTLKM